MSKKIAYSKRVAFWLTLTVSVAMAGPLLAQEGSNAAIAVTVTNSDGFVVLPGVTVTATNAETGKSKRVITDTNGTGFCKTSSRETGLLHLSETALPH